MPSVMPRWAIIIGSFGYVGYAPFASGTVASAIAALFYYFIPPLQFNVSLAVATVVVLALGWWATIEIGKTSTESDPSFLVYDEVAGQWIALLTPLYQGNWLYVLLAFFFFRLFDVVKPFPASYFDRTSGPTHVFMDDVAAAIYANLAAHLVVYIIDLV